MEVYIEDVILDNLIIDFLILLLTAKLLRKNIRYYRLIIASLIGVLFTILNVVVTIKGLSLFLYKFILALLMVIVAYGEKKIKKIILNYITFIFVTLIVGGGCFFICFNYGVIVMGQDGTISYQLALPLGIIVGVIMLISFFLFQIFEVIKRKAEISNFVYKATLCHNNRQIHLTAFLDTGNTLIDPITNKPVLFITYDNFKKLFKSVYLQEIFLKKIPKELKDGHYIDAYFMSKKSKILVFTLENIILHQNKFKYVIKNASVGVTFAKLNENLNCGLLLNSDIIKEKL